MPNANEPSHPLEPLLRDAEAELKRRLREACEAEAGGVSNDSSAEIRQLEDTLLAAAVAAEQTIVLRRHIERRPSSSAEVPRPDHSTSTPNQPNEVPEVVPKVREFRD